MVRIIHTSDTHLGYSQYHLSEREQDFFEAFSQVIDDAIEENVDVVVHAGDLFHSNRPNPTTIERTVKQLQRLNDADIPFFSIIGNHDETTGSQWVDIFKSVELSERLTTEKPIVVDDVAFYGLDHVTQSRRQKLQYNFGEPPEYVNKNILVAHGLFSPLSHGNWDAKEVIGRSNVPFDAMLLGDDHTPKTKNLDGVLATYPSSTERTASDQREPRGYNYIDTDKNDENGLIHCERKLIDTRNFVYLDDIILCEGDDVSVVKEAIDGADLKDSVAIIEVEGEGEPIMQAAVEQYAQQQANALKAKFYDRRISDGTESEFDVSFADPNRAVEQRIRDMGLSELAVELEREIRGNDIAKTTLPDQIQSIVNDKLSDSPDSFDSVADLEPLNEPEPENKSESEQNDEASTWDEQYDSVEEESTTEDGEESETESKNERIKSPSLSDF